MKKTTSSLVMFSKVALSSYGLDLVADGAAFDDDPAVGRTEADKKASLTPLAAERTSASVAE